jgi:pimeloyl-ACP methyl ester carboxylesterase
MNGILYRTVKIDGVDIFFREAGSPGYPVLVMLHGLPSSSYAFRDVIPCLAQRFHVIAPDFPGFGNSAVPGEGDLPLTFDRVVDYMDRLLEHLWINRFSLYMTGLGGAVGFRVARRRPESITSLIVQNANAYSEGLADPARSLERIRECFLSLDGLEAFYTHGARSPQNICPDAWNMDHQLLQRPGREAVLLDLLDDYGNNPSQYAQWQAHFRNHQPPTLVIWGKRDPFYSVDGAFAYEQDLQDVEVHLLDTGHFALEEEGLMISNLVKSLLERRARTKLSRAE